VIRVRRKIYRPIPIDEEIKFNRKRFIVSKTDINGRILFVNKNFCELSLILGIIRLEGKGSLIWEATSTRLLIPANPDYWL